MLHFEPNNGCAVGYRVEGQRSARASSLKALTVPSLQRFQDCSWNGKAHSMDQSALNALRLASLSALKKVGTSRMSKNTMSLL